MPSNTYDKFLEAEFFLKKLSNLDETLKERIGEYKPFEYYVSAFLSAFRSITFVMQREFHDKAGFPEWYNAVRETLKQDESLKLIANERNKDIHEKPLKPDAFVHIDFQGPGLDDFTIEEAHLSFKDAYNKSIVDHCKEAIEKIAPLVKECEDKFYTPDRHIGNLTIITK